MNKTEIAESGFAIVDGLVVMDVPDVAARVPDGPGVLISKVEQVKV